MKSFFFVTALILTSNCYALPVIESVKQRSTIVPSCDLCNGGPVVTITEFTFSQISCRMFPVDSFDLSVEQVYIGISEDSEQVIEIKQKGTLADCAGPTRVHKYQLTTDLLETNARYILKNPSVLKVK